MLKRWLWLMCLSASANVLAADWVALPAIPNGDSYFYDNSKLVFKDDEVTYWKKVQFKSPQQLKGNEVVSGILRERVNCAEHTAKLLTYLYYTATGETVEYVPQDESAPSPIVPDTVGDSFDRVLCPMVWRKQEEARIKNEQKTAEQEMKDVAKPKEKTEDKAPLTPQRSSIKAKPLDLPMHPPPKLAPGTLPSKNANTKLTEPNVRLPDKAQPLPDPQVLDPKIMEQLY